MKLIALGVGDTFTERHATHALLVEADGFRLGIDCPDSYRRVLKNARDKMGGAREEEKAALDLFGIDDLLVTHVHGDHMNGLEGVGYFKFFAQQKPLKLHTIQPVRDVMWEERLRAPMGALWNGQEFTKRTFEDYFAWSEVGLERTVEIGPLKVTARLTKHHVPTSALLIEHGGTTIGISSDTAFDPSLIAFLSRADVIVHETNYGPAHTAYKDLLTVEESIRKKMHLIHYPDEFDIAGSEIPCLVEGQVVSL